MLCVSSQEFLWKGTTPCTCLPDALRIACCSIINKVATLLVEDSDNKRTIERFMQYYRVEMAIAELSDLIVQRADPARW
jgi:hypothetical protein